MLSLWATQRVERHTVWSLPARDVYLDLRHGDIGDAAVQVGHWLESQFLPQLEPVLDLQTFFPLRLAGRDETLRPRVASSAQSLPPLQKARGSPC